MTRGDLIEPRRSKHCAQLQLPRLLERWALFTDRQPDTGPTHAGETHRIR